MMCMCPGAPSSCFPFLVARCIWETQALLYARCDASYLARVLELHSKRWPCIPVCRSLWCRFSIDAVVHSHLWAMFKLVQVCQLLFVISMCSKQVMGIEAWRVDFSFSPHFTGIPKAPFLVLFSACFSFQSSGNFFTSCLEYFHIIKADIPWNLRGEIPKALLLRAVHYSRQNVCPGQASADPGSTQAVTWFPGAWDPLPSIPSDFLKDDISNNNSNLFYSSYFKLIFMHSETINWAPQRRTWLLAWWLIPFPSGYSVGS